MTGKPPIPPFIFFIPPALPWFLPSHLRLLGLLGRVLVVVLLALLLLVLLEPDL